MSAASDRDEDQQHRDIGGCCDPRREAARAHAGILP
jgi:hypothetical protein